MFYFTCNESKIYESYNKKWTFSRHSNLLRCTFMCVICVIIYAIWQVSWVFMFNRFLILIAKSLSALLYDLLYYGGPVPTANKS